MNTIKLYRGDCLDIMPTLPDKSVDLFLVDLPYGTTQNKWDVIIPFEKMWVEIKRLRKGNTPVILFGTEPFSSYLRLSNLDEYKYDWIWDKVLKSGHLNAKRMPMSKHEKIHVFGKGSITYNPQMWEGKPQHSEGIKRNEKIDPSLHSTNYGNQTRNYKDKKSNTLKYPESIISFQKSHPSKSKHPTEKPIELLRYLIRTYSNEGSAVCDFTMGSGRTGVSCVYENRNFIGIEKDDKDKKDYYLRLAYTDIFEAGGRGIEVIE